LWSKTGEYPKYRETPSQKPDFEVWEDFDRIGRGEVLKGKRVGGILALPGQV